MFGSSDNRQADLFFDLRPGVLFAYDAPRVIHELNAELDILEYLAHSDTASVTVRGGWKGFFLPGPRSEMTVSANGGTSQLNALTSGTAPNMTGVGVTPGGRADVKQADVGEYFSWTSTKETRTSQAAFARWTNTDDAASQPIPGMNTSITSAEVGGNLGFETSFEHNAIAIEAGGSYLYMRRRSPGTGPMTGPRLDRQLNPRGSLSWRHDIDQHWSTSADAGVVYVHPIGIDPDNPGPRLSAPFLIVGGLVAYTELWGRATLNARRAVAPNQFIAQNTLTEDVTAQIAMPLPWLDDNPHMRAPKLVGLASVGVERSRLIDAIDSTLAGTFKVARLDAGVAYSPRSGQTYGLRYELMYQTADNLATMAFPSSQSTYFRNTLYFTFALRYPERVAVRVPRRGAGQSVRADRKDLSPVGAEPVVPDPTDQLPEGEGEER